MTSISVTFLICLSEARPVLRKSRRSARKKSKSNELPENEESKILKDIKSVEESEFESSLKYVIAVERPIKFLQIEYEIIPKLIYNVEVSFWGPVAKITTKESVKFLSSITKLKHMWITFTIEHRIVLDIHELMLLKSHTINFHMQVEKNNTINSIGLVEQSTFFFLIEDIDLKCLFIEAFEYIPNNDFDGISKAEEDVKIILQDILHFAFKGEVQNFLNIPGIIYRKKILNMINLFAANIDYKCYNTYPSENVTVSELLKSEAHPSKRKSAKLKESKTKKSTKKRSTVMENNNFDLNIPGEVLFTDPKMTTFKFARKTLDMKCGYIIINVDNLMNPIQRNILSPVAIKLNKLINVPVDMLIKERFEYLYLTYNLCDFTCTTGAKPIDEKIYFRNHKIFFLEKMVETFAQLTQKDYLTVQLHGIRKSLASSITTGIFGTHPLDEFISEPLRNKRVIEKYSKTENELCNESAFIAGFCFKLNMLLSPVRSFTQTEYCVHPNRCPAQLSKNVEQQLANSFTINSINIDNVKAPVYPLSEDMLLDSEFYLEVQMEIYRPIKKLLDNMIEKELCYNRIILITGQMELTKYILSNVFTHNSCWIYKDDIVPPNYLPNFESNTDINNVNIISGFSIDNGDIYIMYLEGNSKWIKNVLWQHIQNENFACAKVLYNSDHVYKDRVYTNLIPYGGICNITLHTSLKAVLDSSKIFSPGYLPEPCRRAFEKIDMILKSKSTNEITINMLPTTRELLSLDIEWGVPIYWPIKNNNQ